RSDARLELQGGIAGRGAPDVADAAEAAAVDAVSDTAPLSVARAAAGRAVRRQVTVRRAEAARPAGAIVDDAISRGRLLRDGDTLRRPGAPTPTEDPVMSVAMDRLEAALSVTAPPAR